MKLMLVPNQIILGRNLLEMFYKTLNGNTKVNANNNYCWIFYKPSLEVSCGTLRIGL